MIKLLPLVIQAKAGDKKAMEIIIDSYMPLILKFSKNHRFEVDEDCKQYLIECLICAIKKFNRPLQVNDQNLQDIDTIV